MNFFYGFAFGMLLQISVGPVFFAVLHKSINDRFSEALKMILGVTLVDAIYILISFTAISELLKMHYLNTIIKFLGTIILILFGINYIKNANRKQKTSVSKSSKNSFIYGIELTAINPLTIVFWSSAFSSIITTNKTSNIFIYSIGCISSTFVFLSAASFFGSSIKKFINLKLLKITDYAVGIILICFGLAILFN
ncbi:LysE family translocator [Clostridium guangxiense]|uniref:LysE family translocator n=1 Tax=Clostridium guangxiense TaxID=1662055 RepID=UPI001E305CA1|nr:LysE family transporter [Clostridium guangxiense]MCD2345462.1 LysE family translocator [Clostridium guangxiense]